MVFSRDMRTRERLMPAKNTHMRGDHSALEIVRGPLAERQNAAAPFASSKQFNETEGWAVKGE